MSEEIIISTDELKRLLDLLKEASNGEWNQDEPAHAGKGLRTLERALACYKRQVQDVQDQMRELMK